MGSRRHGGVRGGPLLCRPDTAQKLRQAVCTYVKGEMGRSQMSGCLRFVFWSTGIGVAGAILLVTLYFVAGFVTQFPSRTATVNLVEHYSGYRLSDEADVLFARRSYPTFRGQFGSCVMVRLSDEELAHFMTQVPPREFRGYVLPCPFDDVPTGICDGACNFYEYSEVTVRPGKFVHIYVSQTSGVVMFDIERF